MLQSMYLNSKESETIANVSKELTNYNTSKENCYNYNEEVLLSVTRKLFKEKPKPTFIQRNKGKLIAGASGLAAGGGGVLGYTRYINSDTQSAKAAAREVAERVKRAEANSAYYREKYGLDEHGNPIKGWFDNTVDAIGNGISATGKFVINNINDKLNMGNKYISDFVSDKVSKVNTYIGDVREKNLAIRRAKLAEKNSEVWGKDWGLDKYGNPILDKYGNPVPAKKSILKDWQNVKDANGNDVMLSAYVDNPYTRMKVVDINNTTNNSKLETLGDLGKKIFGKTNETVSNVVNSSKKLVDNVTDSEITKNIVEFGK